MTKSGKEKVASAKDLKKYVEGGGVLVAFRNFPRKDDHFQSCNLLGFHDPARVLFEFKRNFNLKLSESCDVKLTSSVYSFDSVEGKPIQVDFGNYGIQTIGYQKKLGEGTILHLGVEPGRELILGVLRHFRVAVCSNSTTRDVKTALFQRNGSYYLVAVNNGKEDKSANVHLTFPELKKVKKMIAIDLFTKEATEHYAHQKTALGFDIPRKDGKVIEIKVK